MSLPEFSLTKRRALVTGGGRGIGQAIALTLAAAGCDVAVTARTQSELDATASEICAMGSRGMGIAADVRDRSAVRAMVSECVMHLGGIDIVVNDAGNLAYGPLVPLPGYRPENRPDFAEPLSVSLWSGVLDTHLFGAIHVLQEVAPIMLEQRYGRVINVTSVSTSRATPFNSIYDTAKGGLTSLTRSLAAEWARYGVTVNAIAPGEFRTALSASMHDDPNTREKMLRRIPMRRAGELREVGLLAAFLASDAAAYITGQTIGIDGGESV